MICCWLESGDGEDDVRPRERGQKVMGAVGGGVEEEGGETEKRTARWS